MAFGHSGVSGSHVLSVVVAQIKKGVDLASFQIRRTKEILAMLMIQVTLSPDDATKIFVQVIKKAGLIVALYVSVKKLE